MVAFQNKNWILHTGDYKTAWTSVYGFFILKSKTYIESMAGTRRRLNLSVLFERDSTSGFFEP